MTSLNQIYKCEFCGNIVEILHPGMDALVCCNKPMTLQKENTQDASHEKHIPVIEGNKVKIGSIPHPMEEAHYIEWIEGTNEKGIKSKVFLKPNQTPEAEFCFTPISARCYCNLHGLWKSE